MATEFIKKVETINTGVNLELTLEEAYLLAEFYSKVGGDENFSPRKYFKSIADKLLKLGIKWKYSSGNFNNFNAIFDKKTYIAFAHDSLKVIEKEAKALANQK